MTYMVICLILLLSGMYHSRRVWTWEKCAGCYSTCALGNDLLLKALCLSDHSTAKAKPLPLHICALVSPQLELSVPTLQYSLIGNQPDSLFMSSAAVTLTSCAGASEGSSMLDRSCLQP